MKTNLALRLQQKMPSEKISLRQVNLAMPSIETQLISDLKKSKRIAQEKFYKDYFPSMFPIAFRYSSSKEEAHEIINTAFLSVIKNINKYTQNNFSGWVSTIVKRTAVDYYRKNNRTKPKTLEIIEVDEISYNDALSNLNVEDILKLVQRLPNTTRTVFNLFVFDGMKHEEISQLLSISKGTSKWHVSNGRSILTELYNKINQEK